MLGSDVLDVAIGMVFAFLTLSLLCSGLQEVLAKSLDLRSKNLKEGIENLLADPNVQGISNMVYAHPLIKKLGSDGIDPSHIPAREFSLALADVLRTRAGLAGGSSPFEAATESISKLPDGDLKTALSALVEDAQGGINDIRKNLEGWFDDSMDRVSEWYKRSAQKILLIIAAVLTLTLNVDSIEVAKKLWQDPAVRATVVAQAGRLELDEATVELARQNLRQTGISVGWGEQFLARCRQAYGQGRLAVLSLVIQTLVGWAITAFAVSLGAPFWFDGLQKLFNLRGSGERPEPATA